jgi:hypothetical protein
MKTIYTYLIICLFSISSAFSQSQTSKLSIKIWDNSLFTIVINDNSYDKPSKSFLVNNLADGNFYIKVTKHVVGEYAFEEVIYKGYINIPAASPVVVEINRHNMLNVMEIKPLEKNKRDTFSHKISLISDTDYDYLISTLQNTNFDSRKLELAKQYIHQNALVQAIQLYQVLTFFDFEATKLEFAKYAFQFTTNKQGYKAIKSAFSYQRSIDELNLFLKDFKDSIVRIE